MGLGTIVSDLLRLEIWVIRVLHKMRKLQICLIIKTLLLFGAEYFIFQFAIQKVKDQDI